MEDLKDPKMRKTRISRTYLPAGTYVLHPGTLIAAVIAVILAQMALAIPAVLNGLFQQDLGTSSSQLTWISDAFLIPVCLLELSFGVLGDLFGRTGAIFLLLFVLVERRSEAPLLRLDFFRNRNFAAASVVTILGMFSFLGIADCTSIRLAAIQGFSPLKTAIAFLLFNGIALVQLPLTIRLMERTAAKWPLLGGLMLMAAGAIWMATIPASDLSLIPVTGPFALIGIGFALALTAVSAIAVNTPPTHLAGMASGTTNMFRDFGFTLGPAVIGAVALSQAAADIQHKVAASAALRKALATFNDLPAHTPFADRAAVEGAVHAVASGPLGANAVPATITLANGQTATFNPLKGIAFDALSRSYSHGFLISGAAALAAALVTVFAIKARADEPLLDLDSLDE
jgi:Major Facilitator Superfamily